jgi:hypothetical protein
MLTWSFDAICRGLMASNLSNERDFETKNTSMPRPQFTLKWLIVLTAIAAPALGYAGVYVKAAYEEAQLDRVRPVEQLIFTKEELDNLMEEWEEHWNLEDGEDAKSLTPFKVHGGVI